MLHPDEKWHSKLKVDEGWFAFFTQIHHTHTYNCSGSIPVALSLIDENVNSRYSVCLSSSHQRSSTFLRRKCTIYVPHCSSTYVCICIFVRKSVLVCMGVCVHVCISMIPNWHALTLSRESGSKCSSLRSILSMLSSLLSAA